MHNTVTLKSLAALALDHDVDFEVLNGWTNHTNTQVRAQMVLSLPSAPQVRVRFGDKPHGQQVTSVTLADTDSINVKLADLLTAIQKSEPETEWFRALHGGRKPQMLYLANVGNEMVRAIGRVESAANGTTCLVVRNHLYNEDTGNFEDVPSTVFRLECPAGEPQPEVGSEVTVTGHYVFPHTLRVSSIS